MKLTRCISALLVGSFACSSGASHTCKVGVTTSNVVVTPSGPVTVNSGATARFTVTPLAGFALDSTVGGTCAPGNWEGSVYSTGDITADCVVSFTAMSSTPVVTASGDGNEVISPAAPQSVSVGSTASFTVTANSGYAVSGTVGGSCATGAWNANVYTTGSVADSCTVIFAASAAMYTVTPSGDGWETFTPNTPQMVAAEATPTFTVTAATGHALATVPGGTCPAGTWTGSVYRTGPITATCTVIFNTMLNTFAVMASGDGQETISPGTTQMVPGGQTQAFSVTADQGYTLSTVVGGTCPQGTWNGSVYTTGAIEANCTVTFSATANIYVVTPSGDGYETFSPTTPQSVAYGATQAFTVNASPGYTLTVNGTCPPGLWNGDVYTTGLITMSCMVVFMATVDTYVVTATGDGFESISPLTQSVAYGSTASISVSVLQGYTLSTGVGGSCSPGTWNGGVYTTGTITGACSVTFSAALDVYTVTPSGDGEEIISPSTPQTIGYGDTISFTVMAQPGYSLSTMVGGTCPQGTWAGSVFTTGSITADCTVIFASTQDTFEVAAEGDGNEAISPTAPQTIGYGDTASWRVSPVVGYTVVTNVGGTCPEGTWAGDVYTTGPITATCIASFTATPQTFEITLSGGGWETTVPVLYDDTDSFTVTAETGYTLSQTVGGTCPMGSWNGDVYTTGQITSDCSLSFSAIIDVFTVTASGDGSETITPMTAQVDYDQTESITVTADSGFTLSTIVGGTCAQGTWSGSTYTTGQIVGACTVTFSAM